MRSGGPGSSSMRVSDGSALCSHSGVQADRGSTACHVTSCHSKGREKHGEIMLTVLCLALKCHG